ncbi:ATP-binding cassette domain-containing protein [Marinibaculum pumilum]|uniref:ATP-binding cassette domain-containing protein n=1 Tax=Marinibaculum pumilum TaxID=1766165 RepID=A0ABV7L0E6_9PROT
MEQSQVLAIEVHGLAKRFGSTVAVDGLDLSVRAGSIYGLLGPNGAGKTTTVRLLATLLRPDAGQVTVLGHDVVRAPQEVRRRIALTGQFASVDETLSGRENLVLLARLLGFDGRAARSRAAALLQAFDLEAAGGREVRTYSGGMRRRLDIAASLIVVPDLLFLDEPTTGLDPASRAQVWDIVRELAAAGTTVLLTTQYLEEADRLADRIAVIDRGHVIAEGTSGELKASTGTSVLHLRLADASRRDAAAAILDTRLGGKVHPLDDPHALSVQVGDRDAVAPALAALGPAGIAVDSYALGQPSLDEVFLALTGHGAVADGSQGSGTQPGGAR